MTSTNFNSRLKRQLQLLWANCRSFDAGEENVALEIATRLRVIFHTTKSSTSALKHLGRENVNLLSTASDLRTKSKMPIVAEGGLTIFSGNGWKAARHQAQQLHQISYLEWWDGEIVSVYKEHKYTRKMIVTDSANKDDGAHIAASQPGRLQNLAEGPWKITTDGGGTGSQPNLHFQYLRQFAYETLHSEELLDLVTPDFRMQTDESYEDEQRIAKQSRLDKLIGLHETARKLPQDSFEQIIKILDYISSELGDEPDPSEARLYLMIKWTESGAFEHCDPDRSRSAMLNLCDSYKEKIAPMGLAANSLDIYVKALYEIGGMYAKKEERQSSEDAWCEVRDVSEANIKDDDWSKYAEPLKYYLWSAVNIAVHALNSGEYQKVYDELAKVVNKLDALDSRILSQWSFDVIVAYFGSAHGVDIARCIIKALRNKCIAELGLGDEELAVQHLKEIIGQYGGVQDDEARNMLDSAKSAFEEHSIQWREL